MRQLPSFLLAICLLTRLSAQIPNTLLHSIPSQPQGTQSQSQHGFAVAVDGVYVVAGAHLDDVGATDAGTVRVYDSVTGGLLHLIVNPSPTATDIFGRAVAVSGSRVVVGASNDDTGASNAGIAYVYDLAGVTPTVPVLTLLNPSPGASDFFGASVAISGKRIVIGTPQDDTGATNAGSAYVYDLDSVTPATPVFTLNDPGAVTSDLFGTSVSISGARIVIGAPQSDAGATDAGSAYVYDLLSGTPMVPTVTLNNPTPTVSDLFGFAVAISGTRVVVGAYQDDTVATNSGSAYAYDIASGTPSTPTSVLVKSGAASGGKFGLSVALSGNLALIGDPWEDTGASNAGSAYVFDLSSGTPATATVVLHHPEPSNFMEYGGVLAISGNRAVIGVPNYGSSGTNIGIVYEYDLGSATPTVPSATLKNVNRAPVVSDSYGSSVALSGSRLIVGAPDDDTDFSNSGSVYLHDLAGSTPTEAAFSLRNPGPGIGEKFGYAVAISGTRAVASNMLGNVYVYDLSGATPTLPQYTVNNPTSATNFGYTISISGNRLAIGAIGESIGGSNPGVVFIYDLNGATPTTPALTLNNPSPVAGDQFGSALSMDGNLLVVGVRGNDTGATDAGLVYVYDLAGGTPSVPTFTLLNPEPQASDRFGYSAAISGSRVIVGAPLNNAPNADSGSAYIYDLSGISPVVPIMTLNNPGPAAAEQYGVSVSISGTRVLIGTSGESTSGTNAGAAYVYDMVSNYPTVPAAALKKPVPIAVDNFGLVVAMDGNYAVAGCPFDDVTLTNKGGVYVFSPGSLDQDGDSLLDAWELTWWPNTTGHGPLGDDDQDGTVNLLELAFGLNPTRPGASALPPAVNEGGYLTLTITKQPGVTYEVQSAGTLLPALPDSFSPASTTLLIDNATTLKVRDTVLMSTPGGRFMRAAVTASP